MDGCNSFCKLESGFVCPGGSCTCDVGKYLLYTGECVSNCPAGFTASDVTNTCSACGNGVIDLGENCDDGNFRSGDGCNILCIVETGYVCNTPGQACTCKTGYKELEGSDPRSCVYQCPSGYVDNLAGKCVKCGNSVLDAGEVCDDGNS